MLLDRAAAEGRALVSHDRRTMIDHFRDHLAAGKSSPGLLFVSQGSAIGDVVEAVLYVWALSCRASRSGPLPAIDIAAFLHTLSQPLPYVANCWDAERRPVSLKDVLRRPCLSTTHRYVHPQTDTSKAAIEKARGGHSIVHSENETAESRKPSAAKSPNDCSGINGRGERIRTSDLLVPNQAL